MKTPTTQQSTIHKSQNRSSLGRRGIIVHDLFEAVDSPMRLRLKIVSMSIVSCASRLPWPRRRQQGEEECETLEYLMFADHWEVHDEAGHDLSAHTEIQIDSPVLRGTVSSHPAQRLSPGYGWRLTLSGRHLTITQQPSMTQPIRHSRRHRLIAIHEQSEIGPYCSLHPQWQIAAENRQS